MDNPLYPPRTPQQGYRPPVIGLSSEDSDQTESHLAISNNQRIPVQQSLAYQSVPVDLRNSRHSQSSQMSLLDQAQNIEIEISKESLYSIFLGIDFLLALSGLAFFHAQYYYALQNMYPSFFFVILVAIYAKASLNTLSQRYTFIAYTIIAILNFWAIITIFSIDLYDNKERRYLCYLIVSFILHLIIASMALKLAQLMQERDILLAPFEPNDDPHIDSEWQQVYALDSQDQLTSFSEKYNKVERMIGSLIEERSISLALVHFGALLGFFWIFAADVVGFQIIFLFLGGVGAIIYTKVTQSPLGQICFLAIYSMTVLWHAFNIYVYLIYAFSPWHDLQAEDYWIVVSLLCSPYFVYNVWRLAKWNQEREALVAHVRRFHNVILLEQI